MRGVVLVAMAGCAFHRGGVAPSDGDGSGDAGSDIAGDASLGCIRDIDATRDYSCAVRRDGTAWCWGANADRQLGDNTTNASSTPVRVGTLTGIVQIATSSRTAYARDDQGQLWAWGLNDVGQLGDGTTTDRGTPAVVAGVSDVADVDAGRGQVCVRTGAGAVWCWGYNSDQQVGDSMTGVNRTTPFMAATGAVQLTAEGRQTCMVDASQTVTCWGDNASGEMGLGTFTGDEHPQPVPGFTAVEVAAGGRHTCARKSDGTVWCWGDNRYGQVGLAPATTRYATPQQVAGIDDATALYVGGRRSCTRRANGEVWCWGETLYGVSGTGQAAAGIDTPHAVAGLTDASAIVVSAYHVCAVQTDGVMRCLGRNDTGELGDGTTSSSTTTYATVSLSCS
jgi:alpha-tubulin suppressor-like RCC1 family protein